jgi:hypothetical protein
MILTTLLLAAVSSAAPQRIYQCRDARGATAYQDRPCDDASRQQLSEGGEQALRRWLEQQRAADVTKRGAARTASRPATARAPRDYSEMPLLADRTAAEERLIASCSERFLNCARSDAAAMDACVASLPRCGHRSAGCCPAACIESYQGLRREGEGLASAVRLALLDPFAPSCAAHR